MSLFCSGKCSGCGLTLQRGDITPKELEVLRQHMDAILEKVFAEQSRDVEYDRSRLKQLKETVKDNDFGMVIDGMNISHKGRKAGFDKRIVSWLDIAGVGAIAEGTGGWQMWVIIPQVDTQT